ncbi:MAG: hypothetical protein KBF99_10800 [Leptospiraceae bacterium]|nr:hypothetical protein [Leptospiraceae bacterium]MBL0266145.1 hypothetical protein [Leptospiraceae bacterium]MBP9163661.1 hypothetical protein [Leptospiraceae bacterium]
MILAYSMKMNLNILLFLITIQIFPQSQEEILKDLSEDNAPYTQTDAFTKESYLEKLKTIYLGVNTALEKNSDKQAIEESNRLEQSGITSDKMKIRGNAELGEEQILYLKIRRLRAEAYYNLRDFKGALSDSKFIVENHPRPVVFDFTRYAVSLYYSGDAKTSKRILAQAKSKFKNENDQTILSKTNRLLFPEY